VELTLEYQKVKIRPERHDYQLQVKLKNTGTKSIAALCRLSTLYSRQHKLRQHPRANRHKDHPRRKDQYDDAYRPVEELIAIEGHVR
jgi:hypothetical protein